MRDVAVAIGVGGGLLVATAASIFAGTYRTVDAPSRAWKGTLVMLAFGLWPVLVVGAAQLGLLLLVRRLPAADRSARRTKAQVAVLRQFHENK